MTQVGAVSGTAGTQYFLVPSANGGFGMGFVPGTTNPVTWTINIDDGTLAAIGTDATPFFDILTQGQGGTGPFNPSWLGNYSNRMVYVGLDQLGQQTLYVSNIDDWQHLTQDQNVIYLPGNLPITACFVLYNTLYIVGPHWTYSVQDNGQAPVTWASPQLIDSSVGTMAPLGTTVNASQGVAWVCDVNGLYLFSGGAFGTLPISYYQTPDWNRINWEGAATTVQVVDNRDHKRVYVIAPLDGATSPNFILTWDYSRGLDPQSINYSLDSITGYNPSSVAVVQSPTTNHLSDWFGPSSVGQPIISRNIGVEPQPYSDLGQPVLSLYQTALLPPLQAAIMRHSADHLRLSGQGNCYFTVRGLDGQPVALPPVQLTEGYPAKLYFERYDLLSEVATVTLSTLDLNSWFQLSQLTHYYSLFTLQR